MTKQEFIAHFVAMYRAGNRADSDDQALDWTRPAMAGEACCRPLDLMMQQMVVHGVLTDDERQAIYDTL